MAPKAVRAAFLCVLGAIAALSSPANATTDGTLNVYRHNPPGAIRADAAAMLGRATLVRFQEAFPGPDRRAVRRAVRAHPRWGWSWGLWPSELAIAWDRRTWARVGYGHLRRVSPGAPGGPPRWLAWQVLTYRPTGLVVTVANVHPNAWACHPNPAPWRVRTVRTHWRNVAAWTRRQESAHPGRPVLLGGDFNCSLENRRAPFMPGPILSPLYRFDSGGSIDRLITSRGAPFPRVVRRWAAPMFSDHNAQFRRLRWTG